MLSTTPHLGRFLQLAAAATIAGSLALGVGGWLLLSALNTRWVELVRTTDDGLARVEGLLTASTELAGETADGLESVDRAVDSGTTLSDQSAEVVASVQDVMIPLIDNVDVFASDLEDLAAFIERNDALGLLGLDSSIDRRELEVLRRDLARLRSDIDAIDMEGGLASDVEGVSDSLDSVVSELRLTEAELRRSSERVGLARQDLDAIRDDLAPGIVWGRALLIAFLVPLALTQLGLFAVGRALRTDPPAERTVPAMAERPELAMAGER